MNKEKQIDEMANIIALKAFEQAHLINGDENLADIVATDLYEKGYRKIYDDHERQCTCYALGCRMAEGLKRDVAREIFEELELKAPFFCENQIDYEHFYEELAELKKKYTKEITEVGK